LAYFRFFWTRFNAWGDLAATVLGIPLSVLFWFILDFQSKPIWQGTGMLFIIAMLVILAVTLITPKESEQTLKGFYLRCISPAGWKRFLASKPYRPLYDITLKRQIIQCINGIIACTGMAIATNAIFVKNWIIVTSGVICMLVCGFLLIKDVLVKPVTIQ
jgi:high-affinity Fe2+/Pb2+ permease